MWNKWPPTLTSLFRREATNYETLQSGQQPPCHGFYIFIFVLNSFSMSDIPISHFPIHTLMEFHCPLQLRVNILVFITQVVL